MREAYSCSLFPFCVWERFWMKVKWWELFKTFLGTYLNFALVFKFERFLLLFNSAFNVAFQELFELDCIFR
jgi:hypothetical protein